MIYIGSIAAKHWFPDFREPKDADFLVKNVKSVSNALEVNSKRVEYYDVPPIYKYIENPHSLYLSPDLLYTLKVSHCLWDIHWDKTMFDIQFFQNKGCKLNVELFYELYEYWKSIHNTKRTNFDKSNEDFFNDKVVRTYNHDDLHRIIMKTDQPLFNLIKKDLNGAEIDADLFGKLDITTKFDIVREEAYVIALERWLIPEITSNPQVAYSRALKALITRLSPVWLVLFIAENYSTLKKLDSNFYLKFKEITYGKINTKER